MQKFKFWYQLEDNGIRKFFGPSVQDLFSWGVRGPLRGARPTVHTETAVFPEPIYAIGTNVSSNDAYYVGEYFILLPLFRNKHPFLRNQRKCIKTQIMLTISAV